MGGSIADRADAVQPRPSASVLPGHLRPPGARGHAPVDAFQKHRQLGRRERHHAVFGLGPHEPAPFQPLGVEQQALGVSEQTFHQATRPTFIRHIETRRCGSSTPGTHCTGGCCPSSSGSPRTDSIFTGLRSGRGGAAWCRPGCVTRRPARGWPSWVRLSWRLMRWGASPRSSWRRQTDGATAHRRGPQPWRKPPMPSRPPPKSQLSLDLDPTPQPPPGPVLQGAIPALADLLLAALGRAPEARGGGDERQNQR